VLHVKYRLNVISTHREDDTGKFARGFILSVVLGIELRAVISKTMGNVGYQIALTRLRPLGFPGGKSSGPMQRTEIPRKLEFDPYMSR
jgi:hypothetical protein